MKTTCLIFICCLSFFQTSAQETAASEPKKLQQIYLGIGLGGTLTSAENFAPLGQNLSLSLSATTSNNLTGKLGYFTVQAYTKYYESTLSTPINIPLSRILDTAPYHKLNTIYIALGKRRVLNESFQFQATGGITYTKFTEVLELVSNGPEIYYRLYDQKIHHKPGIIIQAECMYLPISFAGITLGGYYHFVPKISNGGFTLSLNLGRISTKEIL